MSVQRILGLWRQFISIVNRLIREVLDFLVNISWFELLGLVFGIWFFLMHFWVRNFSWPVRILYWLFILTYFLIFFCFGLQLIF